MKDLYAYTPETPRERVIVYQLLSKLKTLTENTNSHVFCILPVTTDIPKEAIYDWIKEQHKILEEEYDKL